MNQRIALVMALTSLLTGCASAPRLDPIRPGEPVALAVVMAPKTQEGVDISNQALGNNTVTGMASGMVVGGAWGLTCGPLAILCVPLGALAGGVTGTVAGAAVGVTGALSEQKATQLRDRMLQVQASHDLRSELDKLVAERARKSWSLVAGPAPTNVTVALHELRLTSTRDEQISFVMQALVTVQRGGQPQQKLYSYVAPASHLSLWLDASSDFLDTGLSGATQQLAAQIVAELALP